MNSFGTLFRISLFGESHGKSVGVTIDGCPAGLAINETDFIPFLDRRRGGNVGGTPRKEEDIPLFMSGIFNGFTTGAPITIIFENKNIRSADYEEIKNTPRPGHADFVINKKFNGFNDYRGGGHSSGRLTLPLVAASVVAFKILQGITINAKLIEAGGNSNIEEAIAQAIENQDSIGGIVSCVVDGLPVGLGEPFFNSIESLISHAVFSIPAIKGIEFGSGFKSALMTGSMHNDAILDEQGTTNTNNAGGINGGISNGNSIVFRVAVKPTSSTPKEQNTWNNKTLSIQPFTVKGRHDLCIALRVPVVIEAVTAIVLADLFLINRK